MKYEIEIDGLPEGWAPVGFRFGSNRDTENYTGYIGFGGALICKRVLKKYDWSKTLDDVLVLDGNGNVHPCGGADSKIIYGGWQHSIHRKCPVDPEASVVRVKRNDGSEEVILASKINWGCWTVIGWRFEYLAGGYEW